MPLILAAISLSCGHSLSPVDTTSGIGERLLVADVGTLIAHSVEEARTLNEKVVIAVTDRDGAVLGIFRMAGIGLSPAGIQALADEAVQKARTAAFLSSNQHGFTTLTACFITRPHFPPGAPNLPGGPLFGVPFSSLPGGDIQPNGSGLSGSPGGVPVFVNGALVGGLGISGGGILETSAANLCGSVTADERIALAGVIGYEVPAGRRGDTILIDGIRFLFANSPTPSRSFTLDYADLTTADGIADFAIKEAPAASIFPLEGDVVLTGLDSNGQTLGAAHDFSVRGGLMLTQADVRTIIDQAVLQADRTRAAIRRPIGAPARVFISVVDLDGKVLGIHRTRDATLFSFDVSAQKARTALAFSLPAGAGSACPRPGGAPRDLGATIRDLLGLDAAASLSMTTRAAGFLSQDFYPPGIDLDSLGAPTGPGPLFGLQEVIGLCPFGNGITIFPGGIPLYKNGVLAGAIGVSGDGVDQDDLVASAGTIGFEPPPEIRCDRFSFDGARLPYVKFPRNPEVQ